MALLLNFVKNYIISVVIFILLAILIWFRGPEFAFFGLSPFKTMEQRFCMIALIAFVWFLKFIFIDTNPKRKLFHLPKDARKKLERLQGRFQGALEFLKKTVTTKQDKTINLLRLPWCLIIGPSGAGKSTLLSHSTIPFILAKNVKSDQAKITQADMCDWWVTRDLVLVDVPGTYLISKTKHSPSSHLVYHLLWRKLLHLVHRFHRKKPLHGIIVALPLPQMVKQPPQQKNKIMHDICRSLNDLSTTFGAPLPIYLVITKCDLLPGFMEFFGECTLDEIGQSWGFSIPHQTGSDNVIDLFIHRFNILIKQLNKQLISKLHQERNSHARPCIKDFPLHVEQLKENIAQCLKAIMQPQLQLQGVYLTSGKQETEENQNTYLSSALDTHQTQALQLLSSPPPIFSRSYFVRQMILHHFLPTPFFIDKTSFRKNAWQRRLVYTASIGGIIIGSLFLGRDFQMGVREAYSIQNELAEYQIRIQQSNHKTEQLITALPLLNALKQAVEGHQSHQLLLEFYTNKSQQTAKMVYAQALQTIVIPEIKRYFEMYLSTARNRSSETVYHALKAYLMLGDKEHFEADYVTTLLEQLMPGTTNKEAVAGLSAHIEAALHTTQLFVTLDDALIASVRNQLLQLPHLALGLVILKNNEPVTDTPIELGNHLINSSIFSRNVIATQIPSMFTAKRFQEITEKEASKAAGEALSGNWVLGYQANPSSEILITELAAALQTQYIENYVDIWESFLANIQLNHPKNLSEINTLITTLTSDHSPLLLLLDAFKQNTSFAPILSSSPRLQQLSILLVDATHQQPGGLYGIFVGLKQLQQYLQTMLHTNNPAQSVFDATAKRIQNPIQDPLTQIQVIAETTPEPMKTWLNTIAKETWTYMLQDTGHYVDTLWKGNIMTMYHASIADRYPFNQTTDKEVELQQFVQFLGQQGLLSQFYQTYLKPFIVEVDKKREWRKANNQQLPFSNHLFETFEHVNRIQRAFFPNADNTLYVPFTLQPMVLDKSMKSFTININGQEIRYQKNMSRLITWPGNNAARLTSINFVTQDNALLSATKKGDWSWFRLVNQSTDAIRSRKELALTFDVDGHKAKYLLFTQGHLNPFLPLNLSSFTLPEQLTSG